MNIDHRADYIVYELGGKRIFAVPRTPWRLRKVGLARYQPYTLKRKIFRRAMSVVMNLGADRLFYQRVVSPVNVDAAFEFDDWVSLVSEKLDEGPLHAVVYWPPDTQRKRIYVHLIDKRLRPVGFAKVALACAEAKKLDRECSTLKELAHRDLTTFHAPSIICQGQVAGVGYSVFEPIPLSAKPIGTGMDAFPAGVIHELAGSVREITNVQTTQLSWWNDFRSGLGDDGREFVSELDALLSNGIKICRVHGDFGAANIVSNNGRLWVYDWEESRPDGPILTDEIGFLLSGNLRKFFSDDPRGGVRWLNANYMRDKSRRVDVMMAVAIRAASGIDEARKIVQHWE